MQITIKADATAIRKELDELQARTKNLSPIMRVVGRLVRDSVVRNFEAGGRPERWLPTKKKGKKSGIMTLIESHRLMNSITSKGYPDRAEVGTNVVYAAIHQFGGTIQRKARVLAFKNKGGFLSKSAASRRKTSVRIAVGKAHETKIPARPFLMVQDKDWTEIKSVINNYIMQR